MYDYLDDAFTGTSDDPENYNRYNEYYTERTIEILKGMTIDNCYVRCLFTAVVGSAAPPLDGEAATYTYQQVGKMALEKAKRLGIKTVTVRWLGAYLVPGLGTASTAKTFYDAAKCSIECAGCKLE